MPCVLLIIIPVVVMGRREPKRIARILIARLTIANIIIARLTSVKIIIARIRIVSIRSAR